MKAGSRIFGMLVWLGADCCRHSGPGADRRLFIDLHDAHFPRPDVRHPGLRGVPVADDLHQSLGPVEVADRERGGNGLT